MVLQKKLHKAVVWIERSETQEWTPPPGFAELVIGPATSGWTRWLKPGYVFCNTAAAACSSA
jgi:hypothetical protein